MNDLTRDSDRILQEGRALVRDNRDGGRHRLSGSIGRGSADLKRNQLVRTLRNLGIATGAILVAAMVIGFVINGLGFGGIMATALVLLAAWVLIGMMGKVKVPKRADLASSLAKGDVRQLVARTELWLEHQTPALPAPAVQVVQDMGVQLDALGLQLESIDQNHPKAREVRKLVGEHLPEMVESYRRIPAHMRGEKRGDRTPDEQLTEGLGKISEEISSVTRQLAEGSLDDLAIKHRYLDYRYGSGPEGSDAQLPPPKDI